MLCADAHFMDRPRAPLRLRIAQDRILTSAVSIDQVQGCGREATYLGVFNGSLPAPGHQRPLSSNRTARISRSPADPYASAAAGVASPQGGDQCGVAYTHPAFCCPISHHRRYEPTTRSGRDAGSRPQPRLRFSTAILRRADRSARHRGQIVRQRILQPMVPATPVSISSARSRHSARCPPWTRAFLPSENSPDKWKRRDLRNFSPKSSLSFRPKALPLPSFPVSFFSQGTCLARSNLDITVPIEIARMSEVFPAREALHHAQQQYRAMLTGSESSACSAPASSVIEALAFRKSGPLAPGPLPARSADLPAVAKIR